MSAGLHAGLAPSLKFAGPVAADATGKLESEEQPAAPVAESNASPMERDDAGVTPGQDGEAGERKTDAKGNPIYKLGDRVEYISGGYEGRHGAISQVMPMVTTVLGLARDTGYYAQNQSTSYYYHVKTDNGADFMANPEEIRDETEKPDSVVPDITVDGMVMEPRRVFDGIGYAKRSAEGARAAAQRARKASSIADHKRTAERNDAKAAEYQAAWDAWAEKYPEEAEKVSPKPAPKGLPAAKVPVSGDALKDAGLTVTKTTTKNDKPVWEVGGNTKEHSDMLKRIGGRWYGPKKVWSFYNDDPTAAISEKLGGANPAAPVIDLAENEVQLPDSPYVYRKEQNGWTWRVAGSDPVRANNLAPAAPIIEQLEADLARKNPKIMGKPVIDLPDTTLENLADQESAAGEKARAELEARDQADEVDLGALFDEVLAEETGKVGAGETASAVTDKIEKQKRKLREARNAGDVTKEAEAEKEIRKLRQQAVAEEVGQDDERFERAMRAAATTKPATGESGYVQTTALRYVAFADALKIAREAVAAGVKPVPAQFHTRLDLTMDSALRLIEALGVEPRTAGQAAASAAINTGKGLMDAIDGLGKLFGSNGSRLSMGVSFDEDTYKKAKPLFAQAVAHFKDAGSDIKEAMRSVVKMLLDKFGQQVTENMKPYIVRFMEDVKAGNVVYDEGKEADDNGSERGKDTAQGSGNQGSGDRIYGSPGQADQEGMGGTAPENVGAAGEAGASGRPGAGTPDGDVGRIGSVSEGGNAANGRPGAGGTRVADAGAGGRGRSGGQSVGGTDGGNQPGPRPAEGSRAEVGNYHIADPEQLIGGTPKVRFARNRKAIEALQSIQSEGRQPTPDELDAMAGYIGWGSFGQELFQGTHDRPKPKAGWEKESDWLREHLGKEAWESAQASIINAHYTDPITVSTMWDMVRQMGFNGGRVLEPSMGVGNFFGLMPRDLMARSRLAGIEMDTTTGGMAKLLYPDANIQIKPYQDSKTADNFYDLVIGNWPFAKDGPADRRYLKLSPSLHDFFFLKALDQTRPGGLVVGITSAGTMDKQGSLTRAALAEKADLVASFRLPTGAFEKYAGTSVVTDIIILKKRETPNADVRNSGWLTTVEVDTPSGNKAKVNEYYASNPGKVLGTLNFGHGTTYGRPAMIVDRPADLESRMGKLAATLPEGVFEPATTKAKTIQYVTNNTKDRQQSIVAQDGKMYQVRGEYLAPLHEIHEYRVKDAKKNADREAQLGKLIDMRRKHGALIDAERDGLEDVETRRKALNDAYKAFTRAHGPLADSEGMAIMRRVGDPFYPSLAALEVDGKPATILSRATMRTKKKLENPSVRDALIMMRNESVFIDMARVAEVSGVSEESASKELMEAGAVFLTPEGTYDVSDVYLSGNVRRKLREAEAAAEAGMNMERNIEALKRVIPADVPYFNIEAKLGATWVPPEYYKQFIEYMLGTKSDGIEVRFVVNRWKVRFNDRQLYGRSEAQTTWGTPWIHFDKLIAHAMGNMAVKIWGKDADGNKVINEEASAKANEKANKIREEFGNWLWADPVRKIEMERAYNEVMNAIAIPSFDGSFMTFEGMALQRGNSPFDMRSHQGNAVYRGLVNRRGIYAHEVGTGKTYTMGSLAVESRRYGIAKKPLIFAHNANSSSVAREIGEQYPGAKVLYIDNLAPDRIDVTMRQIANDEWDAIVVPHSLISRFALKEETLMEISRHEIEALEQEAIDAANDDGIGLTVEMMNDEDAMKKVRSHTAKQLVHGRNQIIKKIKEMALKSSKEGAVSFEDMGIDMIIVDEAHEFKKPPLATRMSMKGLNKTASNQSISLMLLADYVKRMNGGTGVHVFTGTPITNTINEIYNMMRFVMDDQMSRDGVREWDAWFNTFADQTSDVELTPAGEYEPVSRLAAFVNVPELRRMAGQYMDIVFADDMPEFNPRQTKSGKTLASENLTDSDRSELLNGRTEDPIGRPYKKVINDVAEMSPEQVVIFDELRRRAASFKAASKKERKEIMLSGDNRNPVIVETAAANAGLDARLYDMEANDSPESKVNRVVKNVLAHYNEHDQATQVIFVDKGYTSEAVSRKKDRATGQVRVEKKPRFNLVRDIVTKLTAQGIPLNQIAIVDGSVSKEKRKEIADAMNLSKIRVVIGLTDTLGVGVNMQANLRAMHHMDAPWMPGELEQRNGRGHRQGNKWNTVLEYRYITERIDGRRWQVLSIKERFIKSFLKADDSVRVIEGDAVSLDEDGDLGNTLSDAAGDPRLLLMNKLRADVLKLENRERMHAQGIFDAKREIGNLKDKIERVGKALANYRKDSEKFRAVAKDDLVIEVRGRKFADAEKANEAMELVASKVQVGEDPIEVAKIWGFTITAAQPVSWRGIEYQINGAAMHQMGKPTIESARATMYGVAKRAEGMEADIAEWTDSIPRMEEATKAPFARAKDLEKKRKMLADIEVDIQRNPVPAPSWLRNGAPAGTEVFVDGKPLTVEGHRYTSDGYYLTVSDGDGARDIDYTEAMDENGLPKYEEREFEAPKIIKADDKPAISSKNPPGLYHVTNDQGVKEDAPRQLSADAIQQLLSHGWKIERAASDGSASFNASVRARGNPLDAAALEATIGRITSASPSHFGRETVVWHPLFADLPSPILEKAKAEGYDEHGRHPNGYKIPGITYDGKVYLVQENISSELEAEETLLHERIHQIVHGNAKDPDGVALRQSLGRLYLRLGARSGIERMATEAGIDMTGPLAALPNVSAINRPAFLAEEFLAHAEGQRAYEKFPAKIKRAIREFYGEFRDWLRGSRFVRIAEALGSNLGDFTQSDLAWTLKGIRQQEAGAGSKAIRFMTAYHGTPHEVDQFSTDKIGTGEGAQAYGWGMYFASAKAVAEHYRNILTQREMNVDRLSDGDVENIRIGNSTAIPEVSPHP
jgi:N12 class adenine-specific DNA methylase